MKKNYCLLWLICVAQITLAFAQKKLTAGDHFAPVNGIQLHYYVKGKGPVCLVPTPGWGPNINYLKNSMTPLEKYFTMVYYDTRISGQSTGPKDTTQYTSQDFLNDMDSLRVYLQQPKVWIMGHSMGGFQVLNYGIQHSKHLHGIIALSAMAGMDSLYEAEFNKILLKRKDKPYFEKGSAIFLGKDTNSYSITELMPNIFPFYFHDEAKIAAFQQLGDPQLSDKAGRYTDAAKFGRTYLFPELHKIQVPTLVVVGDDDLFCDKVSQADRIAKNIPNATEVVITEAGHFAWIEQPKQFFDRVEKWVQQQLKQKRK